MSASLKQIQTFAEKCRDAGAKEVEIEMRGVRVKITYGEGMSPSQWVDMMANAQASEAMRTYTDPGLSSEDRAAAEARLFASSS